MEKSRKLRKFKIFLSFFSLLMLPYFFAPPELWFFLPVWVLFAAFYAWTVAELSES